MSILSSDEEFLLYVSIHSATPRHAFSVDDAKRLVALAGVEKVYLDNPGLGLNFVGIDAEEGKRLTKLAYKKLDTQKWKTG